MCYLVHVRLAVLACNYIDTPRLIQYTSRTGTSIYQPRPTLATRLEHLAAPLRLDQHQLTRNECLAAPIYDFDHISYRHQPEDTIQLPRTLHTPL